MKQHLLRILLPVLLLCSAPASSQQLRFEQLTTANGLLSDDVYTLLMDYKGYIWACTNYGIMRYNGNTFVPVCTNVPIGERFAFCMYEDKQHTLWFANSNSTIYTIRNDSAIRVEGFEEFSKTLQDRSVDIVDLVVDDDNNIFFSTRNECFELIKKEHYKALSMSARYTGGQTDFAVLKKMGHALIAKRLDYRDHKLPHFRYRIIGDGISAASRTVVFQKEAFLRAARYVGDNLYLFTENTLLKIKPSGDTQSYIFSRDVLSAAGDNDGNVWVGTNNDGLYRINAAGQVCDHYFVHDAIDFILFDDQSGMWVSTSGKGIYHCKNVHDLYFANHPSLMQPLGMIKKLDDKLFIGTSNGQLFCMKGDAAPLQIDLQGLSQNVISDMVPSSDGRSYYIGCKDNIIKADTAFRTLRMVPRPDGTKNTCSDLVYTSGGQLYSLNKKSLYKVINDTGVLVRPMPKSLTVTAYEDNALLIGTHFGLLEYSNDSLFRPEYFSFLAQTLITRLQRAPNGDIWICTVGNGLYRVEAHHKITAYAKIPAAAIHNVFFPNDSTIGLCTNNGIFITLLRNLGNTRNWYQLSTAESYFPQQYDHKLYAATNTGLIALSLEKLEQRNNSKLYFTKAVTDDSVYYRQPLSFRHDQNKIEFYFDLLDYTTSRHGLLYTLESENGTENGTVEGTQLTLRKLSPGNYTLTVSSATSLFYTNEKAVTLSFAITPAFWQTRWFSTLMIISGLFALGLVIYLTNRRTLIRERQKARINRMLAEYKLTALKAQINPHFISNALSAIQQLIVGGESDKAGLYLSKFSLLIRYVLKYSDKSVVKLSDELNVIDLNIQLEALRFKDDFKMETAIAGDVDPDVVEVPPLITQPFIENAIWHGLLPLKGRRKPKLVVSVSRTSKGILISIEDNGAGRGMRRSAHDESRGTTLIVNRLENINLVLGEKIATLTIEDLMDEEGQASGTRVNIVIPATLNNTDYDQH